MKAASKKYSAILSDDFTASLETKAAYSTIENGKIVCPFCHVAYKIPTQRHKKSMIKVKCKKCHQHFIIHTKNIVPNVDESSETISHEPLMDLFCQLLEEKTLTKFFQFRKKIINSNKYNPYAHLPQQLDAHLVNNQIDDAVALYKSNWQGLILSPRVHLSLSTIADIKNNQKAKKFSERAAFTLIDLICKSGDGSKERPYHVLHISDEYDVLIFHRKEMAEQALVSENGRFYDCLTTTEGEKIWFDITDMYCSKDRGKEEHDSLQSPPKGRITENNDLKKILNIAKAQKAVLWCVLANLICFLIPFAFLLVLPFQLIFIYRLAQSLNMDSPIVYVMGAFLPLISLLILLYLSQKATRKIKAAGFKVGLMGTKLSQIETTLSP